MIGKWAQHSHNRARNRATYQVERNNFDKARALPRESLRYSHEKPHDRPGGINHPEESSVTQSPQSISAERSQEYHDFPSTISKVVTRLHSAIKMRTEVPNG